MDLHLHGFHRPITRVPRTKRDLGSSGSFYKKAHFIGLETNATANDVVNTFLKEAWKLDVLPSGMVGEMDANFSGKFW